MQQSSNVSRRSRRWFRLMGLIVGVGALAVMGALLGRGLDAFDVGDAQAHATIVTPIALTSVPNPTARPATTVLVATEAVGQPSAVPSPLAPSPIIGEGGDHALALSPTPTSAGAGNSPAQGAGAGGGEDNTTPSRQPPARLPKTSGEQVVLGLGALGIALYLAGVALFMAPRIFAGKHEEKE